MLAHIFVAAGVLWASAFRNEKDARSALLRQVISPLCLSYFLFKAYYSVFAFFCGTKQGEFDPSGHLTCGIIASCCWLRIKIVLEEEGDKYYSWGLKSKMSLYSSLLIAYHAYTLLFTVSIFHSVFESLVGYLFTLTIYTLVFELTFFTECLTSLFLVFSKREETRLLRALNLD